MHFSLIIYLVIFSTDIRPSAIIVKWMSQFILGFENKTFSEFLKAQKVTPIIAHYIQQAIAMVPESTDTLTVSHVFVFFSNNIISPF